LDLHLSSLGTVSLGMVTRKTLPWTAPGWTVTLPRSPSHRRDRVGHQPCEGVAHYAAQEGGTVTTTTTGGFEINLFGIKIYASQTVTTVESTGGGQLGRWVERRWRRGR